MEHNEPSLPFAEVDKEAQNLVTEHKSLSDLRDIAKQNMYDASTREDRLATGDIYEQVVKQGREQADGARGFSADNLPELKELAEREAVAAGKSIVHFEEEPLLLEDLEEYYNALDKAEENETFRQTSPDYPFAANRARLDLIDAYIKERGISMEDLRPQDIEILAATPEWQDTANQGAHMFDKLAVYKKYDEHRESEKNRRAFKALVAERDDMNARFKAVEEEFNQDENVSR